MDKKLNLLNEKVDKLLYIQEDVTGKLQKVDRGIDDLGKGLHKLTASGTPADQIGGAKRGLKFEDGAHSMDPQNMYSEVLNLMKVVHQDDTKYRERLEKMERMVDSVDKVVKFLAEMLKNSRVIDFILKGGVPWKKGSLVEILEETKDKPEEKAPKGKHVLIKKGIQAEEHKREKKLDEPDGVCEKVNLAGMDHSKTDSGPHGKERTAQLERTETLEQANNSKDCQQQKDASIRGLDQHDDLSCIAGGDPAGPENTDKDPGLEEPPTKTGNPKSKESEKEISRLVSPAREAVPSTSKSGGEIIRTRIAINMHMSDAQEKPSKSQEGNAGGGHAGKCARVSAPPLAGEGATRCPDSWKGKQASKSSRTDPPQGGKGARLLDKQGERAPKPTDPKPLTKADEKGELKGKLASSVAKDSGKDPGPARKSPKEVALMRNDSLKVGKLEAVESGSVPPVEPESGSSLCAGKPPENAASVGAGKTEEQVIGGRNQTTGADSLLLNQMNEMAVSSSDDSPPPPAPFEHRIVSIKQTEVSAGYLVCHHEVLGGGRFGQVHKCTEKSTGLCLAAKIIKVKAAKEREEVKNEINIMNQLNHVNLIQLYDAFECKNNLTLIMEYVDGGELFDRITDENYHLTELDAILFTKQICEGIHYLHQQYILHLDLKPENILCVNHAGNQIKIIDFGLARRYKPREKLKVNFGTPEFLAPEVVNYDFVSFPTDMWSVGVIAYMLLSGLSPFLGETDTETMNYIVNCSWDFDAEAFEQVSEEAKDFVSRLLVKEKSGRISAANCLKHEWLTDLFSKARKSKARLKSQVLLQSYMAHRKWKKHFYAVAAANRLRRFPSQSENPA
ncbi:myosin light chain kinase 3 isoform X2 [Eublepharis macularius]|uniref:Myosin light chain kinase 3 isoform X2 n=1 Tax=Eublepharis macularius TaxID=481883 RepID=A0AA97KIY8_EUBMA|nr:myosin light chain kinase 3 isoform X2 [Eublepharis macularius]